MKKKSENFDPKEIRRLANSDAGKQLMAMLKHQHGDQMQQVMDSMKKGDIQQAQKALSAFMADPRTSALIKQLEEEQT